jgi:hypothetical protein
MVRRFLKIGCAMILFRQIQTTGPDNSFRRTLNYPQGCSWRGVKKLVRRDSLITFHLAFHQLRGNFNRMPWKTMLALVTGRIEACLQRKMAYVLEENRVYRSLLDRYAPRWRLEDAERQALAEKGKPLGKLLGEVITIAQPDTLLQWHRKLVAKKWDYSRRRAKSVGRSPVDAAVERLVIRFAKENPT